MNINGYEIEIIRTKRKSLCLQITPDGKIIARAPLRLSNSKIENFVKQKSSWIDKHLSQLEGLNNSTLPKLTDDEIKALTLKAKQVIPQRVEHYAKIVGVDYGRVTIRHQKSRWGSCSSKGNLNFNCLLMLTPIEVIDSVVVHELCHRLEMNHSKKFYDHLLRAYPNYHNANQWLKQNGSQILNRIP